MLALYLLASCENDYQQIQDMAKTKVAVDEATNIESYLSQNGKVKAKLTAPKMFSVQSDTPKLEFPNSLHVTFFDDSTKIESVLSAKYGIFYQRKNLVFLKDSVVAFNYSKDTLRCDELWWDQDKEIIYTDSPVQIRKPNERIDGIGMVADQNFRKWTIKNAKGPINVADSLMPAEF